MELILGAIAQYVYPEVVLLVVVFTQVFKTYFCKRGIFKKLAPKWITLMVALIWFGLGFVYRELVFGENFDAIKYFTSFGITVISYDYIIKPILDLVYKRKVFADQHPKTDE